MSSHKVEFYIFFVVWEMTGQENFLVLFTKVSVRNAMATPFPLSLIYLMNVMRHLDKPKVKAEGWISNGKISGILAGL